MCPDRDAALVCFLIRIQVGIVARTLYPRFPQQDPVSHAVEDHDTRGRESSLGEDSRNLPHV
jgi:hypothetical protein